MYILIMKTLFALLLISFSTQMYAIHNGKEQKKTSSAVGAIVKIEKSDFPYLEYFKSYPSIKVECSLTRIAKDMAITNTHCIYPYLDKQTGEWDVYKGFGIYISFSNELKKTTSYEKIILHPIKNVLHGYDPFDQINKEFWKKLMTQFGEISWNEKLNKFIPSDLAIIQFDINSKEKDINIAKIVVSDENSLKEDIIISGYGPKNYGENGAPVTRGNGKKLYNSGTLLKNDINLWDTDKVSWFISRGYSGGLPTDSGGFIGKIDESTNTHFLHSLIIMSPYKINDLENGEKEYISPVKRLNEDDIDWINESIHKLYDLSSSNQIQAVSNPRYQF